MTSSQIGTANEKRTHKWLESKGFLVHTVQKNITPFKIVDGKYAPLRAKGKSQDLFGLWDHVAISPEGISTNVLYRDYPVFCIVERVIFIQTKSRKLYGKEKEKYKDFPVNCFLFTWIKGDNGRYPKDPIIERL